jgi:hypothetical protein
VESTYFAVQPPSMTSTEPVTNALCSTATMKRNCLPTSSRRPAAICASPLAHVRYSVPANEQAKPETVLSDLPLLTHHYFSRSLHPVVVSYRHRHARVVQPLWQHIQLVESMLEYYRGNNGSLHDRLSYFYLLLQWVECLPEVASKSNFKANL